MFRLDRLVMYHCETGYMIRLKRKKIEDRQVDLVFSKLTSNQKSSKTRKDEHFERVISGWSDHQKSLLKEICSIFPDMLIRYCGQALIKNVKIIPSCL
jgi:hypothetical protein